MEHENAFEIPLDGLSTLQLVSRQAHLEVIKDHLPHKKEQELAQVALQNVRDELTLQGLPLSPYAALGGHVAKLKAQTSGNAESQSREDSSLNGRARQRRPLSGKK